MQETFDWDALDVHPMALVPALLSLEGVIVNILSKESDEEILELARSQGYDCAGDVTATCQLIANDMAALINAIRSKCAEKMN